MSVEPIHVYLAIAGLIGVLVLIVFFSVVKKLIRNRAFLMIVAGSIGVIIVLLILPYTRNGTIAFFTSIYLFFVNVKIRLTTWYNANAIWLKTQTDTMTLWFKNNPVITQGIIITVGAVAGLQFVTISLRYITDRAIRYMQRKILFAFIRTVIAFVVSALILSTNFMFINESMTQAFKILAAVIFSQGVTNEGLLGLLKDTIINALWRPQD